MSMFLYYLALYNGGNEALARGALDHHRCASISIYSDLSVASRKRTAIDRYNDMLDIAVFVAKKPCKHGGRKDIQKLGELVLSEDISVRYWAAAILGGLGCSSDSALSALKVSLDKYGRKPEEAKYADQVNVAIASINKDKTCSIVR